jgi:hypothetical protein
MGSLNTIHTLSIEDRERCIFMEKMEKIQASFNSISLVAFVNCIILWLMLETEAQWKRGAVLDRRMMTLLIYKNI